MVHFSSKKAVCFIIADKQQRLLTCRRVGIFPFQSWWLNFTEGMREMDQFSCKVQDWNPETIQSVNLTCCPDFVETFVCLQSWTQHSQSEAAPVAAPEPLNLFQMSPHSPIHRRLWPPCWSDRSFQQNRRSRSPCHLPQVAVFLFRDYHWLALVLWPPSLSLHSPVIPLLFLAAAAAAWQMIQEKEVYLQMWSTLRWTDWQRWQQRQLRELLSVFVGAAGRETKIRVGSEGPEQHRFYWALLWTSGWLVQLWTDGTFLASLLKRAELEEVGWWIMLELWKPIAELLRSQVTGSKEEGREIEHWQLPPMTMFLSTLLEEIKKDERKAFVAHGTILSSSFHCQCTSTVPCIPCRISMRLALRLLTSEVN